jgi:hypothetical protein
VVRDVLYRRLNLAEKARWHRAAGEALSELFDFGRIEDPLLAAEHHVRGAAGGATQKASAWLVRTSKGCFDAGTADRAFVLLERTLELMHPAERLEAEVQRIAIESLKKHGAACPADPRTNTLLVEFQKRALPEGAQRGIDPSA